MSGRAAHALDYYDTGVEPFANLNYVDNAMAMAVFNLNFGRYLYDEEYALDPKKFSNLQLKITHNKASGGSAPDAGDLRVRADVFDELVPSLRGFLMSKEHYSYALVSSAIEYVDLPTDHPIRKLLLLTYADDKAPYEQINQVKLSEEHDKRVILEGYQSDFIKYFSCRFGPYKEFIQFMGSASAVDVHITPTYERFFALMGETAGYSFNNVPWQGGGEQTIDSSAAETMTGLVQGFCPHGATLYPFGKQDIPGDWWDVTRLGSVRLKLTAGSSVESSSTAQVIVQQMRGY
jgi:hypothetical protein